MYLNLEAELKRKNITRADLAKYLNCAISTISEKMNKNSEFSLDAAKKIKKFLGVDMALEDLFEWKDAAQTI